MPCYHSLLILTCIVFTNAGSNDYIYVSSTDNIPDVKWTSRIFETTRSENHTSDWAIKLQKSETTALRGCLSIEDNAIHLFSLTKGLTEDGSAEPIKVHLKFTIERDSDDFDIDFTVGISDLDIATVKVNTDQAEFHSAECFIELPGDLNCPSMEGSVSPFKLNTDLKSGIISLGNDQCLPFILRVTFDEGSVAYFHKRWKSMGFTLLSYDDDGEFPVSTTEADTPKKKTDSNLILYIVIGSLAVIVLIAVIGIIVYVIVKNCKKKKARPVVKKKKESPPVIQTIHISTEKPKKDKVPTKIGEKVSKPKPKRPKVDKIPPPAPSPKAAEKSIAKSPDSTNLGSDFLSVQKKPLPSSDTGLTSNAKSGANEKRSGFSIKEGQPEPQSPAKKVDHVAPKPPPRASLAVKSNNTLLKSASAIVPPKTPSKKVIKEKTEDAAKTLATEDNGEPKTSENEGGSKKSEGETSDAKAGGATAKKTEGETEVDPKKTTEKTETDTKKSEKSTKKSKKEGKDKSSKRTPSESSAKDKSSSSAG
uniref:Uncharacterized protein n=1 Tax=Panagrellus redivivus TaxID=6233 RepID=A0A7E4V1P7_PANRE